MQSGTGPVGPLGSRSRPAATAFAARHHELVRRRATEEGGRGLFLVDALSDSWGLSDDRSHVWFEVAGRA
jgi:hypothetical protein